MPNHPGPMSCPVDGTTLTMSERSGIDVLVVRLGLIAALLLTGPVVILFYLLTGWLAADR